MQVKFFTLLFAKISSAFHQIQKSFEDEEEKAAINPLYQSFNLFVKEDLKLALDLLQNGYQPTSVQKEKFNSSLMNNARSNSNFLFEYQPYLNFITKESVIVYLLCHDLGQKCQNEKTIFENFEHIIKNFAQQDGFSSTLYTELKQNIFKSSLKVSSIKPKYSHIYAFDFNHSEKVLNQTFRINIYNSLVLLPYIVKSIDDFVSLRTTIEQSVKKVEQLVQNNNVRINGYNNDVIHYNSSNRNLFRIDTLNEWVGYINKYDTTNLQEALLSKVKNSQKESTQASDFILIQNNEETSFKHDDSIQTKINQLKGQVNFFRKQQIERIQSLYEQVRQDMFEKKQHHELESLYKDLPQVIEKFISIHPDYRDTLKNVEGKSPEQLMIESLNTIENKFKLYWENINQDKVTDLSIVGRAIKMKA